MDLLNTALNKLYASLNSNFWTAFLLSVAGLGTLTMAILQAFKEGLPIRRWFQQYQMKQWLILHASLAKANFGQEPSWTEAQDQIVILSTDGDFGAFYDLEIEKLCGQLNAAIQIAIDSPKSYPEFFSCIAARALKTDFDEVMEDSYDARLPLNAEAISNLEKSRLTRTQRYTDARYRVIHQIQRAIDSFQIKTSFRWRWMFQIASFILSFLLALSVVKFNLDHFAATLMWAAIAGFLAPVARDLFAAIQKLNP